MASARGWTGLGAAIALVAALGACSGSSGTQDRSTTPSAVTSARPAADSNAGLGDAPEPTTAAAEVVNEANFLSPSGNIGCYLAKDGARCDIAKKSWKPPPAPADCELDWAFGVSVGKQEKAAFTCAGDTVLGASTKLAYGRSLRAGDFTCSSDSTAMRCENTKTGHGFTLAVEQYNLY